MPCIICGRVNQVGQWDDQRLEEQQKYYGDGEYAEESEPPQEKPMVSCPRCGCEYERHGDPRDHKYYCWYVEGCGLQFSTDPDYISAEDVLND